MVELNRMRTTPVRWPKSKRNQAIATITSMKAGVCAPIAAIPLLREDSIVGAKSSNGKWSSSRIGFAVEMAETKDIIVNKVKARFTAYLVPLLALERFKGSRDEFDKSYAKEAGLGGTVVPFIETHARGADGSCAVYDMMGLHGAATDQVSTMILEAYNAIWNYRAKNRSQDLTLRDRLAKTLAPAFWPGGRLAHIVPDFDEAVMDGQVALNVLNSKMLVKMEPGAGGAPTPQQTVKRVNGAAPGAGALAVDASNRLLANGNLAVVDPAGSLYAELAANGISVSLANIDMAREVQGFAKLRQQYDGHTDDYIIDTFLMNGIEIPDQAWKQPMLIADQTVTFEQAKRFATDSGNLDDSATSGVAYADLAIRVPTVGTGGVVIVQVEILPEQLWERQRDPFFHTTNHDNWPEALRDFADPQKVNIVRNGEIDTAHATPNGLFGYAPLNWVWNAFGARIGGKFRKPTPTGGSSLVRRRFWAHEPVNPGLTQDFYICRGLDHSIFLDEVSDPFELTATGNIVISGNTQFGGMLVEDTGNYEKVMAQMDMSDVKEGA